MCAKQFSLTPEQREGILRNVWILHDGRWFIKSAQEFGYDKATKLNLAVARSIGKTEMKQLMSELSCEDIRSIEDFKLLMDAAADLYFPEEHKYEIEIIDKNTLRGRVIECYVYKNVSRAGTTDIHQCAATARFDSWLQTLGLDGAVTSDKNTNNCNGNCDIVFKIKWNT